MTHTSAQTPMPSSDASASDAARAAARKPEGKDASEGLGWPPLAGVVQLALQSPKLQGVLASAGESRLHISAIDEARSWVARAIAEKSVVVIVTATSREAQDLTAELRDMMGDAVAMFPAGKRSRMSVCPLVRKQ